MPLLVGSYWVDYDPAIEGETVGDLADAVAREHGIGDEGDMRTFTFKAGGHALDRDLPATELEDREVLELVEVSADSPDGDTSTVTDVDDSEG